MATISSLLSYIFGMEVLAAQQRRSARHRKPAFAVAQLCYRACKTDVDVDLQVWKGP
jgi:hypothetical protein